MTGFAASSNDYTLCRVRDLEPRDILADGTEILGRPERHNRRVSIITENGVESWSEWAKVLVTKWHDRPDILGAKPDRSKGA